MTTLLVLGIFSFMDMPREEFSEVPFFWAVITVPYPGAGAEDVEKQITVPIEDEMQGLENLDEIQSVSSAGLSTVQVRFKSSINKDSLTGSIRRLLQGSTGQNCRTGQKRKQ